MHVSQAQLWCLSLTTGPGVVYNLECGEYSDNEISSCMLMITHEERRHETDIIIMVSELIRLVLIIRWCNNCVAGLPKFL